MQIIIVNSPDNFFTDDFVIFDKVRNVQGFEYPSANVSIEDVAGLQSAVYINSKAGRRYLSFDALIPNDDFNIISLQRALKQGNLKQLAFTSCHGTLLAYIEILSVKMPYVQGTRRICHIEAVAPDWRFYSLEEQSIDTLETEVHGGMAIPASVPYDMGAPSAVATIITTAGSEDTVPRFKIYGPGTSFIISNVTTGRSFTIDYSIGADEYIEINVREGTIKLNGVTDIYSSLTTGTLWILVGGENEINFDASGADVTTKLEIFWRDAFGGI